MEKLLAGKRAIVTGGSRGLGLAIARALAADGAQVLIAGRDEERSSAAAAKVREMGGPAAHFTGDLTVPGNAEKVIHCALETLGGLEILVNNAGVFIWKKFLEVSHEEFDRTLATNLAAPFYLGQQAARVMDRQGEGGSIINIDSIHGKVADPNLVAHCASKFGLIGLTRAMAEALRDRRIRVNAICPGAIDSDSADRRSSSPREKATQADIATMVVYLASDLSQSITGAAIDMHGNTRTVIQM